MNTSIYNINNSLMAYYVVMVIIEEVEMIPRLSWRLYFISTKPTN